MFYLTRVKALFDTLGFVRNEDEKEGQGLVEYALILVLISVVAITIMGLVGTSVSGVFSDINDTLSGTT